MMSNDFSCKRCGGHVSEGSVRYGRGICRKCADAEKHEALEQRKKEWDRHCMWCGAAIPFTYNTAVRFCSRKCQMYAYQQECKEPKEHLEARLLEYMRKQPHYVPLKELREHFRLSDKLLYTRGISCRELNFRAGHLDHLTDTTKSREEIEELYAAELRKNPSLKINDVAQILHVSAKRMKKLGISSGEIRRKFAIKGSTQRSAEEIVALVVPWLREQPLYTNAIDTCTALHIDFKCSIQDNGLDIVELNRLAGHEKPTVSYYEDYAYQQLCAESFSVVRQKTFAGCRDKKPLRYDFWLPDYKVLIEVQGQQHYNEKYPTFSVMCKHDKLKRDFAQTAGLTLLCIDAAPARTYAQRLSELIQQIKGMPLVTAAMQTASNCGKPLTSNVEGNPQPSL